MTGTGEAVVFWVLSLVAVPGALALLFARKAVHAAIGMVTTMIVLGVFYLLQEADFLGVVHIFVYTGAVMMLFLFVVMLVGVDHSSSLVETIKGQRLLTVLVSVAGLLLLFSAIGRVVYEGNPTLAEVNADPGNVEAIAYLVFGRYVWLFEVTAGLLTVSALGQGVTGDDAQHWFEVSLIPETLEVTTLGLRRAGDLVNLETDILARHVQRLLAFTAPQTPTTEGGSR
mgnify:CR=1 FL=1